MSRNISNPDFINGNGFSSSSDSDFDEEFAPQAYPTTTIYERSTIYAPPLASNAAPYETIVDNIVLSATGTQLDVSMDFDINVDEQLVDTSGLWVLPLSGVMALGHDADSSNFIVE